jgi:hypothetical protein
VLVFLVKGFQGKSLVSIYVHDFLLCCLSLHFQHHIRTPQQNEVAERMNKTLMEKSRSMLSSGRLGQEFWAEAVGTACYLVNRSPSSTLLDKTLHEVWIGKKSSLEYLRVFGCDIYGHLPKEDRSKLDNKAEKCIFICYKDGMKGYKLWSP